MSLLLNASAEINLFPINHEIKYVWNATFTVGSSIPVKLLSKFNLNADLIIQTSKNTTTFEVSNILYLRLQCSITSKLYVRDLNIQLVQQPIQWAFSKIP